MSKYQELMNQAQQLMAQAEEAQGRVAGVIQQIKATMAEHGITLADLGRKPGRRGCWCQNR